jgi:hypothetical protein
MNLKEDVVFDVCLAEPNEKVTFVNISYEKIQNAMKEAFENTGVLNTEITEEAREIYLQELARRLNTKGNTLEWRGKKMKMNFSVE